MFKCTTQNEVYLHSFSMLFFPFIYCVATIYCVPLLLGNPHHYETTRCGNQLEDKSKIIDLLSDATILKDCLLQIRSNSKLYLSNYRYIFPVDLRSQLISNEQSIK